MATAYVTIGDAVTRNVYQGDAVRSETVGTSGVATSGALVALKGEIAQVFCATAVYARSGGTATPATSLFCPGGIPSNIAMTEGDVVSIIDA